MNKKALTQRNIVVKKHVVQQLGDLDPQSNLFQVWQPSPFTWEVAHERSFRDSGPELCVSSYLDFPRDYFLVALVEADSVSQVHACMTEISEATEGERVILLAHALRPGTLGDVIVPPAGLPELITNVGYRQLKGPLLS